MKPGRLLVTKELDADAQQKLMQAGFEVDMKPFIEVKEIDDPSLKEKIKELAASRITVVFTSVNAVTIVDRWLEELNARAHWQAYTLEGKTAEALHSARCIQADIVDTDVNAGALATKMDGLHETILFFCGDRRRDELPDLLRQKNISVEEVVIYKTLLTPQRVNQDYDGLLFYSPTAVESFFSCNSVPDATACFAIGTTTANALKEFTRHIYIASAPTKLLELVIHTFQQKTA